MSDSGYNLTLGRVHILDAPIVALEAEFDGRNLGQLSAIAALKMQKGIEPEYFYANDENGYKKFADFSMGCPVVAYEIAPIIAAISQFFPLQTSEIWDIQEIAELLYPHETGDDLISLAAKLGLDTFELNNNFSDDFYLRLEVLCNLFNLLLDELTKLPYGTLQRLSILILRSDSTLHNLIAGVSSSVPSPVGYSDRHIDLRESISRLERPRSLGQPNQFRSIESELIAELLGKNGLLSKKFPDYEPRDEQLAMSKSVAEAFGSIKKKINSHHLIVEGGTGIGKSVAYLLPSILFAIQNNVRVVISTNTISLQEQLVKKDIPDLLNALSEINEIDISKFRYTLLKGKANYACLKRWESLANSEALTPNEARTLAKTLRWLGTTQSGDRSELHLDQSQSNVWNRINASVFATCTGVKEGYCFYNRAREKAAAAHVIVVNHALLLSDLEVGGSLIPEYQYLIVDEAHNLESEATKQFGSLVSSTGIQELFSRCRAIYSDLLPIVARSPIGNGQKEILQNQINELDMYVTKVNAIWDELIAYLDSYLFEFRKVGEAEIRVTSAMRTSSDWSWLDIKADDFENASTYFVDLVNKLRRQLEDFNLENLKGVDVIRSELSEWTLVCGDICTRINEFISNPDFKRIYWVGKRQGLTLNSAPLDVASRLKEELFDDKKSVVLTSATMAIAGDFSHSIERLGVTEPEQLCLGSPFDYKNAALMYLPTDFPSPTSDHYWESVVGMIPEVVRAADGKTLVLFTSHTDLRNTAMELKKLPSLGYEVLAQGVDGTPAQLINRFRRNPHAILLGTASFWEGVDIGNEALKVLIIARLPFSVPTDPIFAARSEGYENAFYDYAIPQAILRFRQGFGRLIRSKTDKGVVIISDSRITAQPYGKKFIDSIPSPTIIKSTFENGLSLIDSWLNDKDTADKY